MGFQATTGTQTNEGHGFGATGMIDEAAGLTVDFRLAADRDEYLRVGELSPHSTKEELNAAFEDKKNKPTIPISSKVNTLFQVNQTVVEF